LIPIPSNSGHLLFESVKVFFIQYPLGITREETLTCKACRLAWRSVGFALARTQPTLDPSDERRAPETESYSFGPGVCVGSNGKVTTTELH